jgi:peptidyl-dipeptidase A
MAISRRQLHGFEQFLKDFVPQVARKSKQLNQAVWLLETTGSPDAADLKAELETELRMLYNDKKTYEQLLEWDKDKSIKNPLLKRQLNILIRSFKSNIIAPKLLREIAEKESALSQTYTNFRPKVDGKYLTDNDIRDILKHENDPKKRQKAWEASKEIGDQLAPQILELVALRNKAAKSLGYSDFFQMQLDLQEVDGKWLLKFFDELATQSDQAYQEVLKTIEKEQTKRFKVKSDALGPWAWSEPFCQEDPLGGKELDSLVKEIDLAVAGTKFFQKMGIDVKGILEKSDNYEREGKNQHAFCINIDRDKDVRTLNNIKPTIKWLETILHELGHAVYELGFDPKLPWLLRDPPHMIPTEAMALVSGRQAYRAKILPSLIGKKSPLMDQADESLKRRQLIFSRWVFVMTAFESELYRKPKQDLNALWWKLVEKFQQVRPPSGREHKNDWASKYHLGLAPVYYFSYLIGELFASSIEESLQKQNGSIEIATEKGGQFLQQKLFAPGNSLSWNKLIESVTGKPITSEAWIKQFAK